MKAVVLVAGKGTRMAKDYEGPKHLLPVAGKPVLEYVLDALPEIVDGIVLVVGGPHEQKIRQHFSGGEYRGRRIEFAEQREQLGLAHAFWSAKKQVAGSSPDGRWLGMVGDDIFGKDDLKHLSREPLAVLVHQVDNPESFGVLVTDENNYIVQAVEKPKEYVSNLASAMAMVMDERFFALEGNLEPSARGEYETPDAWMMLIREGVRIKAVEAELWLPVNDKKQLEAAEKVLASTDGVINKTSFGHN
jgi:dTDP-glucose pyrophosphorylase